MNRKQLIEKRVLSLIEKILPYTIYDRIIIERRRRINNVVGYYPHAVFFSKKKSNEKYCIVRYSASTMGLMAAGIQYIFCYHRLVERGYIPIIDIEYTYSYKQGKLGEANIWDACFEQPISAKDAMTQRYVLATGELFSYSDDPRTCLELNGNIHDHFIHVKKENFRSYYAKAKKYTEPIWKVKDELITELDEKNWKDISGHKILGILLRENFSKDYGHRKGREEEVYANHPLLPGVEEIISIIKKQLVEWKFDYIFLSTIYADSLERFKEEFGNKIISIDRKRMSLVNNASSYRWGMGEKELYEDIQSEAAIREEMAKSYLKEIIALSRCNYLLGGPSSGMAAALVMNGGKYEDIFVLEDERKINRY